MKQLLSIPSSLEGLTKNALEIYKIEKLLEFKIEECEQNKKVFFLISLNLFHWLFVVDNFWTRKRDWPIERSFKRLG